MSSLHEVEEHPWTFPLLLAYSILISGCLAYNCCKSCCKEKIVRLPQIRLT